MDVLPVHGHASSISHRQPRPQLPIRILPGSADAGDLAGGEDIPAVPTRISAFLSTTTQPASARAASPSTRSSSNSGAAIAAGAAVAGGRGSGMGRSASTVGLTRPTRGTSSSSSNRSISVVKSAPPSAARTIGTTTAPAEPTDIDMKAIRRKKHNEAEVIIHTHLPRVCILFG
jgi:hypothetical protein